MYHFFVLIGLVLLVLVIAELGGSVKRIAVALDRQNEFYGIFEQTSEEQETANV